MHEHDSAGHMHAHVDTDASLHAQCGLEAWHAFMPIHRCANPRSAWQHMTAECPMAPTHGREGGRVPLPSALLITCHTAPRPPHCSPAYLADRPALSSCCLAASAFTASRSTCALKTADAASSCWAASLHAQGPRTTSHATDPSPPPTLPHLTCHRSMSLSDSLTSST